VTSSPGNSGTGILGIDHAAILVRDLTASEAAYRALGFKPTPIGHHTGVGTANHCIMLDRDYFEILAVVAPAPINKEWKDAAERRQGLWGLALMTNDVRASHAALKAAGFSPTDPVTLSRPVDMPEGPTVARFTLTYLEPTAVPGMRLFLCQHHTRDVVWRPDYLGQPNGATALSHATVMIDDPAGAAGAYARVFGTTPRPIAGGIAIPAGKAEIRLITPAQAAADFAGDPVLAYARPAPVALGFLVVDPAAAAAALAAGGVPALRPAGGSLCVGSAQASGVVIEFSPA
jgi:catechol 2,3-dioxygenase-like lactoylglutathione lyase family enzyme